jgi:hypothetical protein
MAFAAVLLAGCGKSPEPAAAPVKKAVAKVADETRRFPRAEQVDARVVTGHLLDHEFLPGGNIASYKRGELEYEMILVRTSSPDAAALLLYDYKKSLENPKVIAHFGGFFGKDGNRDAFLFAKGATLCGVLGLPEAEADKVARELAARVE